MNIDDIVMISKGFPSEHCGNISLLSAFNNATIIVEKYMFWVDAFIVNPETYNKAISLRSTSYSQRLSYVYDTKLYVTNIPVYISRLLDDNVIIAYSEKGLETRNPNSMAVVKFED